MHCRHHNSTIRAQLSVRSEEKKKMLSKNHFSAFLVVETSHPRTPCFAYDWAIYGLAKKTCYLIEFCEDG